MPVSQLLRLNVDRIRGKHERVDRRFEPSVFAEQAESYRIVEPVELGFDVTKDDTGALRLTGDLRTTVEVTCSRCVEPFRMPVTVPFDVHYLPVVAVPGDSEREVQEGDLATAFYENDAIELDDLIREQIYLSLPMKPLCTDDCGGLCPTCGRNLNSGSCECSPTWDDPRLAALKALRKREN